MADGEWDDMEGTVAIAVACKIMIVKVSDEDGYEELWSYDTPNVSWYLMAR